MGTFFDSPIKLPDQRTETLGDIWGTSLRREGEEVKLRDMAGLRTPRLDKTMADRRKNILGNVCSFDCFEHRTQEECQLEKSINKQP